MTRFGGISSVEVAASTKSCFELVCDTPRTPDWQDAVSAVEVLERDGDGRTSLVRTNIDALIARVRVDLRISYGPYGSVRIERESGDLRHLLANWTFEETAPEQTRASFEIDFDPGRVLSALARGPIVARLEALLAEQPTEGLKGAVESSQSRQREPGSQS